jgi:hypothetical protein
MIKNGLGNWANFLQTHLVTLLVAGTEGVRPALMVSQVSLLLQIRRRLVLFPFYFRPIHKVLFRQTMDAFHIIGHFVLSACFTSHEFYATFIDPSIARLRTGKAEVKKENADR